MPSTKGTRPYSGAMTASAVILSLVVLTLAALETVHGQTYGSSPSDATVQAGGSVIFQCSPATSSDGVSWTFISSKGGAIVSTKIFAALPRLAQPIYFPGFNAAKYNISNTYSLVVLNAGLDDAGTYVCTSGSVNAAANLVVIGSLVPTLSTVPGQSLSVNQNLTMTCTLQYGVPSNPQYPLDPGQFPQLAVWVGTVKLLARVSQPSVRLMIAAVNTTITTNYVSQSLVCQTVSTAATVPVTVYSRLILPLPYSPQRISLNASSTTPLYTDFVNCTANGYPLPTVGWAAVTAGAYNPQGKNYGPGWAILSFASPKVASWNCSAFNGLGPRLNQTYTFTVTVVTPQASKVVTTAVVNNQRSGTTVRNQQVPDAVYSAGSTFKLAMDVGVAMVLCFVLLTHLQTSH